MSRHDMSRFFILFCFIVLVFPVIFHFLYVEPRGENKHVIDLFNLCRGSACVTHFIFKMFKCYTVILIQSFLYVPVIWK